MTPAQRFAAAMHALPERAQAPLRRAWALSSPADQEAIALASERLFARNARNAPPTAALASGTIAQAVAAGSKQQAATEAKKAADAAKQAAAAKKLADIAKTNANKAPPKSDQPWGLEVEGMRARLVQRYGLHSVGDVPKMTRLEAAALALTLHQTGVKRYGGSLRDEWLTGALKPITRPIWPGDSPAVDWLTPAAALFGWRKNGDRFRAAEGDDEAWLNGPAEVDIVWGLFGALRAFATRQDQTVTLGGVLGENRPHFEVAEATPSNWRRLYVVVVESLRKRIPGLLPFPAKPEPEEGSSAWVWLLLGGIALAVAASS